MPEFSVIPTPHEEAMALIKGKPAVSRDVFDQMLPELRGRVFTITGIECANILQRARDEIARLPEGSTWSEVKEGLLKEISPFFDQAREGEAPDETQTSAAERRAELLMRTHGFQAFNAANWRAAQEDEDTTHLQYLATEDTHVRDSHLALNGIILPKNDPFWATHTPPWEWGCRCRIRAMNPDMVEDARLDDQSRQPGDKLVIEGPALQKMREGVLVRDGINGQSGVFDVSPPSESNQENAYRWHPDDLRIPLADLRDRYDAPTFDAFEKFAKNTEMVGRGSAEPTSLWDWLNGQGLTQPAEMPAAQPAPAPVRQNPVSGKLQGPKTGKNRDVFADAIRAIDATHDDGQLTAIPLKFQAKYSSLGAYMFRGTAAGKTVAGSQMIKIRTDGKHPELTILHEVGHWLAHSALPGGSLRADDPAFSGWWQAVQQSESYRKLVEMRDSEPTYGRQRYLSYLLSREEMWARSYAQFVAYESKTEKLVDQVKAVANGERPEMVKEAQWHEEDFAGVGSEIRSLFKSLGWL